MTVILRVTILWLLLASCTSVTAAINVCGAIANGTVWRVADSPVNVICDLNIAGLTIEPGVEVHVAGDYQLVVSGVIRALGTGGSPVVFKRAANNLSGWGGFYFEDSVAGSEFRWTQIEGATRGAVRLVRSTPLFDHVTFKGNAATQGGAIRAELATGDLQISNSLFIDNFASSAGGAIYAIGPTGPADAALVVTDSVFLRNNAGTTTSTTQNTFGGALYIAGNSRILRSTFAENEARAYTIYAAGGRYSLGGAIYTASGRSEITATTFLRNACRMGAHSQTPDASRGYGGAVYLASGELKLSNSLLAENMLAGGRWPDYRGSGVYVAGGVGTIVNSTLARNSTHAVYRDGGQVDILNSILFFNNNSGAQIAGTVLATYSDIQNGFAGEGNISLNPIFNELLGIVPPSPAIDAGHPSSQYNDLLPPGQGSLRNDMGYTGGQGASHWNSPACYRDADGDGYGDPNNFAHMGSCSLGYVPNKSDCDDTNAAVFPGSGPSCPAVTASTPTALSARAGMGSITLTFGAPLSDGGAAITGYSASCASSNGGALGTGNAGASATSIRISGLTNGKRYTCTVAAINSVGTGPASAPSNALAPFDITPILMLLLYD